MIDAELLSRLPQGQLDLAARQPGARRFDRRRKTRVPTGEERDLAFLGGFAKGDHFGQRRAGGLFEQGVPTLFDRELRDVLTAVDDAPISEPPSGFEREMWARIEPLLPVKQTWRTGWSGLMPRLAVAASIGVLLVAAFAAGRVWDRPAERSSGAAADEAPSAQAVGGG